METKKVVYIIQCSFKNIGLEAISLIRWNLTQWLKGHVTLLTRGKPMFKNFDNITIPCNF